MTRGRLLGGAVVVSAASLLVGLWWAQRRRSEGASTERSVVQAIERVTKLATVETTVSNWQLRRDSKPLFGFIPIACEKTVAVLYRGKVAAGFDLGARDALGIDVTEREGRRAVRVRLPRPKLLYVDVPAPDLLVTDGSVCNRLSPEEYGTLHEAARKAVEDEALAAGVLDRAQDQARTMLGAIVASFGYELAVAFGDAETSAAELR